LLDVERLSAFFHENGFADIRDMTVRGYLDAAESELESYIQHYEAGAHPPGVKPAGRWDVSALRVAFDRASSALLLRGVKGARLFVPDTGVLVPPATDDASTIERIANELDARGNWAAAADAWARLRVRFPDNPTGFRRGSHALLKLGLPDQAERILLVGTKLFPSDPTMWTQYCTLADRRCAWAEAAVRWTQFRAAFPKDTVGYLQGMMALLKLGQLNDAAELASSACARFPDNAEISALAGWLSYCQQNWDGGIRLLGGIAQGSGLKAGQYQLRFA
jgi:tetratricopeptide (TPR) repeat protein